MPRAFSQPTCRVLLRDCEGLRESYQRVAKQSEPGLRVVLSENAQTLDLLIADLRAQWHPGDLKPNVFVSWCALAGYYATVWLRRSHSNRERALIRALARQENALWRAFERAIAISPPPTSAVLSRQLPRLRGIHFDMGSLSGTLQS